MATGTSPEVWKTCHIRDGHMLLDDFFAHKASFQSSDRAASRGGRPPAPRPDWLKFMVATLTPESELTLSETSILAYDWINRTLYPDNPTPTPKQFADENRIQFLPDYVGVQWYLWCSDEAQAQRVLHSARRRSGWKARVARVSGIESHKAAQKELKDQEPVPPNVRKRGIAMAPVGLAEPKAAAIKKTTSLKPLKPKPAQQPSTPKRKKRGRDDSDFVTHCSPSPPKRNRGAETTTPTRGARRWPRKVHSLDTSDEASAQTTDDVGFSAFIGAIGGVSTEASPPKQDSAIAQILRSARPSTVEGRSNLQWSLLDSGNGDTPLENPNNATTSQTSPSRIFSSRASNSAAPDSRPLIEYKPPIWAFGRQAICESLPYFRTTGSGCYFRGKVARGYLIDGCPSERDMWGSDGRVIVSHGGGHSELGADGNMELRSDQKEDDARISALLSTMREKEPIVLLVGRKSQLPPWRMECDYAVLGYYIIVAFWMEKEGDRGANRFKLKFQWLPSQGEPWWIAGEHVPGGWAPSFNDRKIIEAAKAKQLEQSLKKRKRAPEDLDHVCNDLPTLIHTETATPDALDVEAQLSKLVPFEDHEMNGLDDHEMRTAPGTSMGMEMIPGVLDEAEVLALSDTEEVAPSPELFVPDPIFQGRNELTSPPAIAPNSVPPPNSDEPDVNGSVTTARLTSPEVDESPSSQSESTAETLFGTLEEHFESLCERRIPAANVDELRELFGPTEKAPTRMPRRFGLGRRVTCQICGKDSPVVYLVRDLCLNPDCEAFWKVHFGAQHIPIPHDEKLDVRPDFLDCVPISGSWNLPNLIPPPPMSDEQLQRGFTNTRASWRGWHCGECGRLNQRRSFRGWVCPECDRELLPTPTKIDVEKIKGTILRSAAPVSSIDLEVVKQYPRYNTSDNRYRVTRYEIDNCESNIYHLRPQIPMGGEDPADDLFNRLLAEMQENNLLHRYPAKHNLLRGESLSQHFLCNAGAHYKYLTDATTTPFELCPPSMMEARQIVYDAAQAALKEDPKFNEMLTVAYMDEQHMAYHDDGEPGLGPVVASMSLGSLAVMSFRRASKKKKKAPGSGEEDGEDESSDESDEVEEDNVDIEEDDMEVEEDDIEAEEDDMEVDEDEADAEDWETASEVTALEEGGDETGDDDEETSEDDLQAKREVEGEVNEDEDVSKARACLVLNLTHGDILVMNGRKLHDMYKHKVDPKGFRIACTSRYIADASKHIPVGETSAV
ncbi:hypothetical protein CALCODRAFT_304930 [Calocera cornea HHB12733]|uniref:Alpha-ketoglutarate-dependent dioxygenase AlkB-like domain-containing protein n=1 Tax=Calocera cornea HHB12733 TaxID=1353952 RepID=A0A165JLE1_9BASI|nr:hypothetical protein CALCODRAFT_304930 [Calocera cornea HHB12733]